MKNSPKPYLRERARAILKISQGEMIQVATEKLQVRVQRNAVSDWVKRFLSERLQGLKIKAGQGGKSCDGYFVYPPRFDR